MALPYYRRSSRSHYHPEPLGHPVAITRHEPSEAVKVVGVHQALDRNMHAQVAALQLKASSWGTSAALPNLYIEQAILWICLVLTHGAIDTPTGSLLRASLEQVQLEVGISTAFLSAPFESYGFLLTDCFWKSIWSFLSTQDITLSCTDQVLPTCQRTHIPCRHHHRRRLPLLHRLC